MKTKKVKKEEYNLKYGNIPNEINDRLSYILQKRGYTNKDIEKILKRKQEIMEGLRYEKAKIILYEIPEGSRRPRFTGKGFRFYVPGASDNKKDMIGYVEGNLPDLKIIVTPININIKYFLPIPSGFSKEDAILAELGYIEPIIKPDFDNVGKNYTDPGNEVIFIDDSLITYATIQKLYSFKPRIEIEIKWYNKHVSKKILKSIEKSNRYIRLKEQNKVQLLDVL